MQVLLENLFYAPLVLFIFFLVYRFMIFCENHKESEKVFSTVIKVLGGMAVFFTIWTMILFI